MKQQIDIGTCIPGGQVEQWRRPWCRRDLNACLSTFTCPWEAWI
ncbi:MAG: hypothetical protein ACLTXL_09580 [Clostridia bacterium]